MIKYLGSKRTLIPVIDQVTKCLEPTTALDLFAGTTRVGQAFKNRGIYTTVNDVASYAKIFGDCYIATDASQVDNQEITDILKYLSTRPGKDGYFTEVFCRQARFFQPFNGQRVDAIRDCLEKEFKDHPYYPVLLTSLIEAADRVDSTTGLQMAYLKKWATRSYNDLELRLPPLLPGAGRSIQGDAQDLLSGGEEYDLVYIDPPYNQHRYFTNYHIWETLVRWDKPDYYGVACKRVDAREENTKSVYNRKREMPVAFQKTILQAPGRNILISYNNESWVSIAEIETWVRKRFKECLVLDFEYKRYVGAQIGIYNQQGERVGDVNHLKNREYLILGADEGTVARVAATFA